MKWPDEGSVAGLTVTLRLYIVMYMVKVRASRPAGRPPSTQIDHAVLEATVDALAEVGFEALSVADVARRAKSTTPAIYRRYAGKTELVIAAVDHELASLPPEPPDHGSLRADLVTWTRLTADALTPKRTRILVALTLAAPATPEPVRRLTTALERLTLTAWTTLTQRAVARGELTNDRVSPLISRIPAAMITNVALLGETAPDAAFLDELVDAVMLPALRCVAATTA
jgi:AcrR family transcriptional regulator